MNDSQLELEFQYAWDWFSYHARQRLTAFNFFLILMSAVVLGYAQAVDNDLPALGVALGALGAFVAIAFWAMDVRNEELVYCGRAALDDLETRLAITIRRDDRKRSHWDSAMQGPFASRLNRHVNSKRFTHTTWLRSVIALMGLLSLAALAWAAFDFPSSTNNSEQTVVCHGSKASPCFILRSSPHGTATRR